MWNIYDTWAHSKASISFTLEALLLKIYTKKVIANAQRYAYHDIYYNSISNSKREKWVNCPIIESWLNILWYMRILCHLKKINAIRRKLMVFMLYTFLVYYYILYRLM